MGKMCCISLTLAVKLIGTFGLSLSILMINMLVSDFFSKQHEEEFIIALESWMLFGLNWTYVMKNLKVVETARTLLTCVLIYSVLSLVANALLALSSLLKKPNYVLMWMYMQMISIFDQTIALTMQLTRDDKSDGEDKSAWYIPVCSIYLLISGYFWMVVSAARREWIKNREDCDQVIAIDTMRSPQISDNANMPKSPSFLSSNIGGIAYDFPKSLPPPAYNVV
ncbi:PREDICTED: uncharacterized protein LOC105368528 [Ceratosolen solmsi marchali]|uniref:Uncharacterized protein LOC105368528 n=1 Tax=Ceratosolen solmsi marchali TaxID=326594 RepID=A0AAJ6YWX2_9HYME|nr:PREDICTED: uncharacterized protein LOC105368528 [Ceratosolen solmsi marchali]